KSLAGSSRNTHYRASKTDRTFVGNSLGGLFGAFILLTEPDLFSNYILGSPSVWFDDNAILNASFSKPQTKIKVYLSVGEHETPAFGEGQDMVAGAVQLRDKIAAYRSTDIEINFSIISGASHTTAFPTTAIQGLDWVYGIKRK
uniref:alpha/beta hydrolase n=1 Tax=Arsukibacterium sp. TaxID=1977258 RepID=UPI002FDA51E7